MWETRVETTMLETGATTITVMRTVTEEIEIGEVILTKDPDSRPTRIIHH